MANISTVDYNEFTRLKKVFFGNHNHDFQCETSPMDQYGVYYKSYNFRDGATWYERMSPEFIDTQVTVAYNTIPLTIKMLKVEFWNSDNAFSKFYYEVFNHTILNNKVVL